MPIRLMVSPSGEDDFAIGKVLREGRGFLSPCFVAVAVPGDRTGWNVKPSV